MDEELTGRGGMFGEHRSLTRHEGVDYGHVDDVELRKKMKSGRAIAPSRQGSRWLEGKAHGIRRGRERSREVRSEGWNGVKVVLPMLVVGVGGMQRQSKAPAIFPHRRKPFGRQRYENLLDANDTERYENLLDPNCALRHRPPAALRLRGTRGITVHRA